jgi:Na+/proline symporter
VTVIPWFIGAGLLYLISGRIYDCDMLTIPQFIGERYHSRFLRTCCALLLSGGYVFYLVIQIKGFGIAAATLLNIDYKVAIFLVYLFILYCIRIQNIIANYIIPPKKVKQ